MLGQGLSFGAWTAHGNRGTLAPRPEEPRTPSGRQDNSPLPPTKLPTTPTTPTALLRMEPSSPSTPRAGAAGASVRAITAGNTHKKPPPPSAPGLRVRFISALHTGPAYGNTSHACCHQIQLADRLFLVLHTQGLKHIGEFTVAFRTPPGPPSRRCRLPHQPRSDFGESTTPQLLRVLRVFLRVMLVFLRVMTRLRRPRQWTGGGGGGHSCSFAEWQRAWGSGVTVRKEEIVLGNRDFPTLVEECGLEIGLRVFSRGVGAEVGGGRSCGTRVCALLVMSGAMPTVPKCTCQIVPLNLVAAAAAGPAGEICL